MPSQATAEEAPWTVVQLSQALAQNVSSTVRFSEERRLQHLTEPLRTEGSFTYEPPGRLERVVLLPKWERMVVEGDLLTVEKNQSDPPIQLLLSDYPALQAVVAAQRSLLSGDLEALRRLFEVTLEGRRDAWLLYLLPRPESIKKVVREVQVGGAFNNVISITLVEKSGDVSVVTILKRL